MPRSLQDLLRRGGSRFGLFPSNQQRGSCPTELPTRTCTFHPNPVEYMLE
jgi:hypothetical protein